MLSCYRDDVASMAWGARNLISTQAWTDDADSGYYADESFSGDEIQVIVGKAEKIGRGLAKAAGE